MAQTRAPRAGEIRGQAVAKKAARAPWASLLKARSSLQLDPGRLHDRRPFPQVARDRYRKILRGAADRLESDLDMLDLKSAARRLSLTSPLSLATTSAGMPAGPRMP